MLRMDYIWHELKAKAKRKNVTFGSHIFEVYNANYDLIGNIDADGQIANIIDLLRNGHNPIKENWEMEMMCNA